MNEAYKNSLRRHIKTIELAERLAGRNDPELKALEARLAELNARPENTQTLDTAIPDYTGVSVKDDTSKEAKALAALVEHPEWTKTRIAEYVGCNRQSLYGMKKFKAAWDTLKQGKREIPKGQKYNGDIEAFDD